MNRLDELEKKLRSEVNEMSVSAEVEKALLTEFDRKWGRGFRPAAGLPPGVYIAAIAALAACLLLTLLPNSKPNPKPSAVIHAVALAATPEVTLAVQPRPRRRSRVAKTEHPEPRFFRIPYTAPLAPYERAEIVRVDLPVSALTAAGFRIVTADTGARAQADLIVGEDGLAHAIHLISISSN